MTSVSNQAKYAQKWPISQKICKIFGSYTPISHRNNIHTPKPKSNIVPNVDNNNPGNGAKTTLKAKYKIFNEAQ